MATTGYAASAKKFFSTQVKEPNGVPTQCHRAKVHSVSWNKTGSKLASCSFDKTALMCSIKGGRLQKECELIGHTASVDQLGWCPTDDNLLATCAADKTVRIWDARSGSKAVQVIKTKGENINVGWSPDGGTVIVGSKEDEFSFINTKTWTIEKKKAFTTEVNEFGINGDLFIVSAASGAVHTFEWPSLATAMPPITAHMSNVMCLEIDPKGKYFATGSADALVGLWDASEMVCLRTLNCSDYPVKCLSFSFDGQLLAAASEDQSLKLTHVETGETVHKVETPDGTFCVAWHPQSLVLAFAGEEKDANGRDAGMISVFGIPT